MQVNVIIEIPVGGGRRLRINQDGTPNIIKYPDSIKYSFLALFAYGYIPNTYNPADNCAFDTLILGAEGLDIGEKIECKVIGIRIRNDEDHKLVVVKSDSPFSEAEELSDLPEEFFGALDEFVNLTSKSNPKEYWADATKAKEYIKKYIIQDLDV